jgi:hypothetical protein
MKWNAFIYLNLYIIIIYKFTTAFVQIFSGTVISIIASWIMPGSLLIADTVDVHSFTGLGIGDSTDGQGVEFRTVTGLRLQR